MNKTEIATILRDIEELSQEAVGCRRWPEAQAIFDKIQVEIKKLPEAQQGYVWQSVAFSFLSSLEYASST